MRKVKKEEAKKVYGGMVGEVRDSCQYCNYKNTNDKGMRDHYWYKHNIRI